MFRHSLLDVIPEFLESCFVIPLGARAAHGHGLLSPRNRVPEAERRYVPLPATTQGQAQTGAAGARFAAGQRAQTLSRTVPTVRQ